MSPEPSHQREVDIDSALTRARESIVFMRSQVQTQKVDFDYFLQRLEGLDELIENLVSERRSRPDAGRFARLYEVSQALSSSLDLEEVLNGVMDAIIQLTEAERGFLMLLNDDGVLEVQIGRNFDQEAVEEDDIVVSRTITRQVFETGEPVLTTNASEDPRFAGQASIATNQLRSIMASPLRARGKSIGVIYVDNRVRTGLFREADLELVEAFAGQAAVAIDNARLFSETDEKLKRRVDELQTLQWIDRQLNETLDVSKAVDLTVEWALRMCDAHSASLAIVGDGHGLDVVSHAGDVSAIADADRHIDLEHPLISQVLETGQAALQLDEKAPQTIFCVPIRREKKSIGVILVSANREDAFDEEAKALLARMADRAAIAIENGRLYNEVKAANLAKSEFVGTVAHELKVPMTSIQGYADLLMKMADLDQQNMGFATRIKGSVERMQTLVGDLSDISRIESGNLRVELTDVDLKEVIAEAKAGTATQIEARAHTLIEDIGDELPLVKADPARTVQILVNLLSNAYKYTPNGGQITIRTQRQNGRLLVSVADTGVGLSSQELEKLGTKFWRSDNDHTLKQRGTGLGFSITRQLIELMDGTLDIESTVGKGSTFTVGLPITTM